MRVLHVIQNLNYGGMERLLADLVRGLGPRFEPHVLVLEYLGRFARDVAPWAELHQAERLPRYSMLWPGPLIRQIRRLAPDVVHTHSGVWYKASLAARMAGVPRLIHTEHGRALPDRWPARLVDGLASRRTDVVVAVSQATATALAAGVVRDPRRIRVVLNGVDTTSHRPRPDSGAVRAQLGLSAGTPILGSVGRLEWIKGYDIMIEAFALLRREWSAGTPPVLLLAGDGSRRAELEARIRGHGLGDAVHLLGWRDDVHDLLSACALFTMSSRSEGTSVSLLEAMSSGLAPVVTDVGGNRGVLGRELRHRLVTPGAPAALAAAWRAALADPRRLARDAALARERVRAAYDLEGMLEAYRGLYDGRPAPLTPAGIHP